MKTWTTSNPRWLSLNGYERAAVMALMEAEKANPDDAKNVLGAIVNRATMEKQDLAQHTSRPIYQPAIERSQEARLDRLLKHPEFRPLTAWAERRAQGQEADPVNGATHFLAPEKTMLSLEAREPQKYKSWRKWTNFDPESSAYRGVIMRDKSHAFLAPDGRPVETAPVPSVQDYEGAIDPPPSAAAVAVASAAPRAAAPAAPAPAPTAAEPASSFMPKADAVTASQQIAKAVMGFGQQPQFYNVPMIEAQRIGNPGSLSAGMEMADASGLARGFMGRSPADRAISLTRAEGGAVNPAEDTGANLPETESSLVEQQKQVMAGRRPAQMFPNGTPELPVPQGLGRVVTARGVFHFNPDLVSAAQIVEASAEGRENEILGLGPMSKADVMEAAQRTGEKPVAITERTPFGAEVKASMTVPSAVMTQAPEILANKMPGNSVGIEPVEDVVRQRTGMADLDRDRAISTALRVANPPGFARGGAPAFKPTIPYANPIPYAEGPVVGPSGGRADKVKTAVRGGSHVLPAHVVSSLGQGNTDAGMDILAKMFKTGPYGIPRLRRADGGGVPVMVSHGEFVVPPEVVAEVGGGDQDRGHAILDQFIVSQTKDAIETMKRLPGPAKD